MKSVLYLSIFICLFSCSDSNTKAKNEDAFINTLQTHLNAVSKKDLITLKSTMHPDGKMQLILPNNKIIYTSEKFIEFHREWFADTTWTFETKIINHTVDNNLGIATTEILYKEPNRNGKPYFNRMTVTYALQKAKGTWYIIKDHASSTEKSKN